MLASLPLRNWGPPIHSGPKQSDHKWFEICNAAVPVVLVPVLILIVRVPVLMALVLVLVLLPEGTRTIPFMEDPAAPR